MSDKDHRIAGGARDVWLRARRAVTERLSHEDVKHHLAGGSMLAAQWGHRESSDMDMILKGVDIEEAARIMKDIGTATNGRLRFLKQGTVQRLEYDDLPEGRHLDAMLDDNVRDVEEMTVVVEGRKETVATNAEVLARKMHSRGYAAPARDALDAALARREDPVSLEKAVNSLTRNRYMDMLTAYDYGRYTYEKTIGRTKLLTEQAKRIGKNLPAEARSAATAARYTEMTIRVDGRTQTASVTTKSGLRTETREWTDPASTRRILQNGWYDRAMEARQTSPLAVEEEIDEALTSGRSWEKTFPAEREFLPVPWPEPAPERPSDKAKSTSKRPTPSRAEPPRRPVRGGSNRGR